MFTARRAGWDPAGLEGNIFRVDRIADNNVKDWKGGIIVAVVFGILGILCLIYYGVIVIYSGGGMLLVSLVFDKLTGKESLGGGDIKLFFMTGLYLSSAWDILFYLILSCLFGLGFAFFRKEKRVPFGPAIAAACFIMILYGEKLTGWYTGLF